MKFLDGLLFSFGGDLVVFDLGFGSLLEPTNFFSHLRVFVEVCPEGSGQVGQVSLVFLSDLGQGHHGGILLVDQLAEFSLSSNEAVRDVHLPAEGGQPDNQLDGVDVVGNHDEFGLSLFNQLGDMVEAEFEMEGSGLLGGVL